MREHVVAVLQKYLPSSIRPGASGNTLIKCPFHKEGQERKPSFSLNVDTGVFHCFTCHVAGPLPYLLKLLGVGPAQIDSDLAVIKPELEEARRQVQFNKQHFFSSNDPFKTTTPLPETLLGIYEWCPTQLLEAGFDINLLRDFEVGFDRVNQRVMYPLRDMYGTLAGFSGGRTTPEQQPKYKVYQGGSTHPYTKEWVAGDYGEWFDEKFPGYRCENHNYIWNYHRVYARALSAVSGPEDTVVLVEGFKACLWMVQNGYYNTVALMGSYISETQQRLLHRLGSQVVLFFDNDDAGRKATARIGRLLWRPLHGRLKVALYPTEDVNESLLGESDSQPDDYEAQGLHQMMGSSLDFHVYMSHQQQQGRITWQ